MTECDMCDRKITNIYKWQSDCGNHTIKGCMHCLKSYHPPSSLRRYMVDIELCTVDFPYSKVIGKF